MNWKKGLTIGALFFGIAATHIGCNAVEENEYGKYSLPVQLGERLGPGENDVPGVNYPKTFEEALDRGFVELDGYDGAKRTVRGANKWLDTLTFQFDEKDNLLMKKRVSYDNKKQPSTVSTYMYEYFDGDLLSKMTTIDQTADTSFHKLNYYGHGTDGDITWLYDGYVKTNTEGDTLMTHAVERDAHGRITFERFLGDRVWSSDIHLWDHRVRNVYSEKTSNEPVSGWALSHFSDGYKEESTVLITKLYSWDGKWDFKQNFELDTKDHPLILK